MQEILDWILTHPIFSLVIFLSLFEMGKPRKNRRGERRARPHRPRELDRRSAQGRPRPGVDQPGEEEGEQDWMKALRELVKDPERKTAPKMETKGKPLAPREMEVPERFREASPQSALPSLPPAGEREATQRSNSWENDSVFSSGDLSSGEKRGPSGAHLEGKALGALESFHDPNAFAGQGGELVFESSLEQMELESDHSSLWGPAITRIEGGLQGVDPQVLILGQILLGPPRGLRAYEEEASLPGMEG